MIIFETRLMEAYNAMKQYCEQHQENKKVNDIFKQFGDSIAYSMNETTQIIKDGADQEKTDVIKTSTDYEIVRIDSFEQAAKYANYVGWVICHYENDFDLNVHHRNIQYYFCLKKGFENMHGSLFNLYRNGSLDEYGASMIVVGIDQNGKLRDCLSRWEDAGRDICTNPEQISQVIGVDFYSVFKPKNK